MSRFEVKEIKWVIMDKDRTVIAKGSPRNRHLVSVNDAKDKKRILYYSSYNMAKAGYSVGFYAFNLPKRNWKDYELEPVEVEFTVQEVAK